MAIGTKRVWCVLDFSGAKSKPESTMYAEVGTLPQAPYVRRRLSPRIYIEAANVSREMAVHETHFYTLHLMIQRIGRDEPSTAIQSLRMSTTLPSLYLTSTNRALIQWMSWMELSNDFAILLIWHRTPHDAQLKKVNSHISNDGVYVSHRDALCSQSTRKLIVTRDASSCT